MSAAANIALRAIALLCTLLITALIGNVIASNVNAAGSATAAVNFSMFVTVLSWIACIYGIAAVFVETLDRPIVKLPLDAAVTLFTFLAAVVLAAKLHATNCGNIPNLDLSNDWIGFGSKDDEKRCREIQAGAAFMWFLWGCFCITLTLTIKEIRSGFGGSGYGGSTISSSLPSMSQI